MQTATNKKNKKAMALSQVIILIIGIIAIVYIISDIGFVSAQDVSGPVPTPDMVLGPHGMPETSSSPLPIYEVKFKPREIGYVISQEGNTLKNIAKEMGINVRELERYNTKLTADADIPAGTKIRFNPASVPKITPQQIWNPTKSSIINSAIHAGYIFAFFFVLTFFTNRGDFDTALFKAKAASAAWGAGETAFHGTKIIANFVAKQAGKEALASVISSAAWPVAIATAVYTYWKFVRRDDTRMIDFQCGVWQPETGGANCEKCNNQEFPCEEYQCKSLGQACELVNKDTSEPRCVWKNKNDINPPTITAMPEALLPDFSYTNLVSGKGVEIKYKNGCLPAFQAFSFGVQLDKIGTCRIEDHHTANFSKMTLKFGEGLWQENHTHISIIPTSEQKNYEFYVRCESVNGRANSDEFLFKFCMQAGPDTLQPTILGFNLEDKTPITYFKEGEAHEVPITAYINEPANCRWSHSDKAFESMENAMTCSNNLLNINAQLSYSCSGILTGLENMKENKFYFRCNDSSGNIASKELTLIGTRQLVIDSVSPTDSTIKGSSNKVKVILEVKTSAGAKEGEAECRYSATGTSGDYYLFENTNSHEHSHELYLEKRTYNYYVKCVDDGGNIDTEKLSFTVETDFKAPAVMRIYQEGAQLKIITSEEAECVYNDKANIKCDYGFEDGLKITSADKLNHYVNWNVKNSFYIKCKDDYGNQPSPNSCSIIARAIEL